MCSSYRMRPQHGIITGGWVRQLLPLLQLLGLQSGIVTAVRGGIKVTELFFNTKSWVSAFYVCVCVCIQVVIEALTGPPTQFCAALSDSARTQTQQARDIFGMSVCVCQSCCYTGLYWATYPVLCSSLGFCKDTIPAGHVRVFGMNVCLCLLKLLLYRPSLGHLPSSVQLSRILSYHTYKN